ncbi:hypothetical protein Tco_1394351 [Tanacetum coccineum]
MNKCTVYTDHSALKYLFAKKDSKAEIATVGFAPSECDFDVDCPDCKDSRALSFVFHPQEFHILSFILGIQKTYSEEGAKDKPKANKSKHGKERTKSSRSLKSSA